MNEWLQRVVEQIRNLWSQWKPVQKIIFFAVIGVSVVAIILLISLSSSPTMEPLLTRPVSNAEDLDRIAARLDQENVDYTVTPDQRILVSDETTARRMRTLLAREDLIPAQTDPWELFDMERWTQTDFERNVNLQRALQGQLEQHIEALEDIDAANVNIVLPDTELFVEDQNPVTASVIVTPKPGSDLRENRNKVEGIEKLIQFAIEGLVPENITITDHNGIVLNDFEGMADFDRLELTRRELKLKRDQEQQYIQAIRKTLGQIYGKDRVEVININVELDMGKRTEETQEHFPIEITPDNPNTPFSEREVITSIPRSVETINENYEGTGFNPEGPPGQEGQTPPAYQDLESLVGRYSNTEERVNNEINTRTITEEKSPEVKRVTASVALDGVWRWQYDENGEVVLNPDGSIAREYNPVSEEELAKAEALVKDAVGFDQSREDSVTVRHIQFDRTEEHEEEDAVFRRRQQIQMIVLYSLIGIAVLLVSFIVFRLISREIERRRRLREEELARQHQAMREAALRSAEEEGEEVEMSVEERARMELQESAMNMAREHPEDVAQLIRTWLMEE
ncbi:MAG: flagellar basal body M-ring protein FliF [Spirochaetes bacterium]|jgi:flagellar M-ring protein FliF|nr:flagellar basal body M-ring protein FliF [Spirochaetota bacterium]